MWTCTNCSYVYNPIWVEQCDICESNRTPASLTQPSLITVTKSNMMSSNSMELNEKSNNALEDNILHSPKGLIGSFDEVPSIVKVPIATFEQDLEDDFQFMPGKPMIRIQMYTLY